MIGECPFMHGMTHNANSNISVNAQIDNNQANKKSSNGANTSNGTITASKESTGNKNDNSNNEPHYSTYLGNDILLNLQSGPSRLKPEGKGLMHHEEMTFIIVHQTIELYFRLAIHDLNDVRAEMIKININDIQKSFQHFARSIRLVKRSQQAIRQAVGSIELLETMHSSEFIEFREYLTPASGLQSVQFRSLEQLLGLPNATRALINNADVFHYLNTEEVEKLKAEANEPSLNTILMNLLSELDMPASFVNEYLKTAHKLIKDQFRQTFHGADHNEAKNTTIANDMIESRYNSLKVIFDDPLGWSLGHDVSHYTTAQSTENKVNDDGNYTNKENIINSSSSSNNSKGNGSSSDHNNLNTDESRNVQLNQQLKQESPEFAKERFRRCVIAALFVMSYRQHNKYTPIAELLDELLSLEEAMIVFRTRHSHMVERMIGSRGGTAGTSSGLGYLNLTLQYRIFTTIWLVRRMFVRASALPELCKL